MKHYDVLKSQEQKCTKFSTNNKAFFSGHLAEPFKFHHNFQNSSFYKSKIRIANKNGSYDYFPILVNKDLLNLSYINNIDLIDTPIEVAGKIRSFIVESNEKYHLFLHLLVTKIKIYFNNTNFEEKMNSNLVYINGQIAYDPNFHYTYSGMAVANFLVEVERPFAQNTIIPCVAFHKLAKDLSKYKQHTQIHLYGRICSGTYKKIFEDGEVCKDSYQLSCFYIKKN